MYFASSAPGELALPKRGDDGVYHVVGELSLADWSAFRKIFYASIPLLRAGGENKNLILSPLPRFSTSKCCKDTGHITNFGKKGYGNIMGSKLADIHSWIDDFSRGKRIRNYEVICPATTITTGDDVSKKDLAAFWGSDPVHLTKQGYEKLGEQLSEKVAAYKQKKRLREGGQETSTHQRPRLKSDGRLQGVSKSDTFASRWEAPSGSCDRHMKTGGQSGHNWNTN